jgi:hypothetical protein
VSAIVIFAILGGTGVILYGMSIADRRCGTLLEFADKGMTNFPALVQSLPPVVGDMLRDERRPDYASQIEITARPTEVSLRGRHGENHPAAVLEIRNRGEAVVSLLTLRVNMVDAANKPMADGNVWAATPIAGDREWNGPLMPKSVRHITVADLRPLNSTANEREAKVDVEITDVRVWTPAKANQATTRPERE